MKRFLIILFLLGFPLLINAQSINFPTSKFGLSIGNSKNFTGLRINFSDRQVEKINGLNIT